MSTATLEKPVRQLPKPLKWHGGKDYLASRIIGLMPEHTHYVETFAGGLSVLLAKDPEGVSEVVNDLNGELMNFWSVLASEEQFPRLVRILQATPCSEGVYEQAASNRKKSDINPVASAASFFIACRQSRAATFKGFTNLAKTRTRRGMNELPSAWWNSIDGLPEVHDRLGRVVMLCRSAIEVAQTQDGPKVLQYWDPPYVPKTRATPEMYEHEMTLEQHAELLDVGKQCKSKIMISGYDCDLYQRELKDWTRHEFKIPNHAAGGKKKRIMTEVLYCNF